MRLDFDFVVRFSDLWRLFAPSYSRRRMAVRYFFAVLFAAAAVHSVYANGLNWMMTGYLLCVVLLVVPMVIFRCLMGGVLAIVRPRMNVSIDGEHISVVTKHSKQEFSWPDFAESGTADESKTHLVLRSGNRVVWIPKRAIASES